MTVNQSDISKGKWMLRKSANVVYYNPDEVLIAEGVWNGRMVNLVDDDKKGKLARTIKLLNGTKSIEEIVAEVNDQDVLQIVERLRRICWSM